MTEIAANPDAPGNIPVSSAIDAIRERLTGEIHIRNLHGTSLSAEDRSLRDAEGGASKAGRWDETLSPDDKEQKAIINGAISDSRKLKAWLDTRNLGEFDNGAYHLETDPSQTIPGAKPPAESRVIDLMLSTPEFDLNYIFYRDGTFDLRLDFTEAVGDQRPQYRSGRQSIYDGMTTEEAEIVRVYTQDFLDTARVAQKPAA